MKTLLPSNYFAGQEWGSLSGFGPLEFPLGNVNPSAVSGMAVRYDSNNVANLTLDTSSRVSLWADSSGNSGTVAFVSDGTASNTATSPNKSVTGSQAFGFDVLFPDYTPALDLTLVDKLSGNNGFQILLLTTGVVRLRIGDGASVTNVDSTTANTLVDLARGTLGITWTDGVGASFTQNGAALGTAVAAVKTLTNAAVAVTLWTLTAGVVYSFVQTGIYNFNPSGAAKLAPTFVAPVTGETWTINTSGDTGSRLSGTRDLYQGTVIKQPVYLPWAGTNYGYLNAVAANTFSTPDVSVTGSRTFTLDMQLPDYTPAGNLTIVDKLSGNNGYQILLLTTGVVRFRAGNGTTVTNVDSSVGNSLVDGARGTLAVIWTDGVGASFTQNGAALGTAVVGAVTLTNAAVVTTIGASVGGRFYGYTISGIANFNPALYASGLTFTASTGEVWTLNSASVIVTRTCVYGDGANDYLKSASFTYAQPETNYFVGTQTTWALNNTVYDGFVTGSMMFRQGDTSTPQVYVSSTSGASRTANNTSWVLKTGAIACGFLSGAASFLGFNRLAKTTGNAGAAAGNGVTLFCRGDGVTANAAATASELIFYATAQDAGTQNQIIVHEGRKWNIPV